MDLESQFGIRDSIFIIAIQRRRLVLSPSSISRLFHWFLTEDACILSLNLVSFN